MKKPIRYEGLVGNDLKVTPLKQHPPTCSFLSVHGWGGPLKPSWWHEPTSPWSWSGLRWCSPRPWTRCPGCSCTPVRWSARSCAWSCPPLVRWRPGCSRTSWGKTACSAWPWASGAWSGCRSRARARILAPSICSSTQPAGWPVPGAPTKTASLGPVPKNQWFTVKPPLQVFNSMSVRGRTWSIPNHVALKSTIIPQKKLICVE